MGGNELTLRDVIDERCSEGWRTEISPFPGLGGAAGVEQTVKLIFK